MGNGGKKKEGHRVALDGPPKVERTIARQKRPSKHPQGSVANRILTVDDGRTEAGKPASGGGSRINEEGTVLSLSLSLSR